jgi:hypothetical protein
MQHRRVTHITLSCRQEEFLRRCYFIFDNLTLQLWLVNRDSILRRPSSINRLLSRSAKAHDVTAVGVARRLRATFTSPSFTRSPQLHRIHHQIAYNQAPEVPSRDSTKAHVYQAEISWSICSHAAGGPGPTPANHPDRTTIQG